MLSSRVPLRLTQAPFVSLTDVQKGGPNELREKKGAPLCHVSVVEHGLETWSAAAIGDDRKRDALLATNGLDPSVHSEGTWCGLRRREQLTDGRR